MKMEMLNMSMEQMRSNLERLFARQNPNLGYELIKVKYCSEYTPDFISPRNLQNYLEGKPYYAIEVKGKFWREDSSKLLKVVTQNPNLKLVIVFQNPEAKVSARKFLTYRKWALKHGIIALGINELH